MCARACVRVSSLPDCRAVNAVLYYYMYCYITPRMIQPWARGEVGLSCRADTARSIGPSTKVKYYCSI